MLALLRHDEPESQLREGVQKQLSDFLEAGEYLNLLCFTIANLTNSRAPEAPPFVDKLFRSLRSKAFMPYDDGKPPTSDGIPIPLDALVREPRGTKRGAADDGFEANRQPPKGPRLNGDYPSSRRDVSSSSGPRFNDMRGGRGGIVGVGGRGGGRGAGPSGPRGRSSEPCRDYHSASSVSYFIQAVCSLTLIQTRASALVAKRANTRTGTKQ